MGHLLPLVGSLADLDRLSLGVVGDDQDVVGRVRLGEFRGQLDLAVPDPVDPQGPTRGVAFLHGLGDDLADLVPGGPDAVGHAVDHDLRREDAVAAPPRHVRPLARVPPRRPEGVLPPARGVPVGHVVGEEQQVGVVGRVVDQGQRGRARLAALGLEQLDHRQRHDLDEARLRVHVAVLEGQRAGEGHLAALEEVEECRHCCTALGSGRRILWW